MFTEYVAKAIESAEYELIEDGTFFGSIPGFQGAWGNVKTIEACRTDLMGALEGWLVAKLWDHDDDIPVVGKLSLIPRRVRLPAQRSKKRLLDAATTTTRTRQAS